jgi:hypothetical protein
MESSPLEATESLSQQQPAPAAAGEAWTISFAPKKRKVSKKEREALCGKNRVVPEGTDGTPAPSEADARSSAQRAEKIINLDEFIDPTIAIPRNLVTTKEDMALRTHFDVDRFRCVSRPQYKRTCGVSSLTSVWNYLYSRLGAGTLPPVSQEEVMTILGFQPPFEDIRWGSFTGNTTLMRWFHALNAHFGVTGKAYYAWKNHGLGRTFGLTDDAAEQMVKASLRNPSMAFIYHCHNHYMVPIGYQDQPRAQIHAYAKSLAPGEYDPYLFIGEVSRGKHGCLHVVKFSDVALDINLQLPQYLNIRNMSEGVQSRKAKRVGGNLHCFLAFRSDQTEDNMAQFEVGDEADDGVDDANEQLPKRRDDDEEDDDVDEEADTRPETPVA